MRVDYIASNWSKRKKPSSENTKGPKPSKPAGTIVVTTDDVKNIVSAIRAPKLATNTLSLAPEKKYQADIQAVQKDQK